MPRTSRPVTVTLGDLQKRVKSRVESGAYASVSEVLRAALRALDREEAAVNDWLRHRVDEVVRSPAERAGARGVQTLAPTSRRAGESRTE
jgi:antitoxin ParD1/3/4